MKRVALLAIVFAAGNLFASEGTTGAASLKLAAGARGQSLGEAYTAGANGAEAMYWNPAGLAVGPVRSIAAGLQPMPESVSSNQFSFAARFGRLAVGAGYGSVSAGNLDAFDTVGNQTGSFDAKDQTFSGSLAFGGPAFSVGVTGKMWKSDIDGQTADAVMADAGLAFQNPIFQKLRHGLVVRHIGGDVSYISQKDPLPTTLVFGNALRLGRAFVLSADYGHEKNAGGYAAGGLEWAMITRESFSLALRGGYNTRRTDAGDLGGVSAGAGIGWRSFAIDYAWVPFGEIGDSHAVTLRMAFGDGRARSFKSSAAQEPADVTPVVEPAVVAPPSPVKSKIDKPEPTPSRTRKPIRRRLSNLERPTRR